MERKSDVGEECRSAAQPLRLLSVGNSFSWSAMTDLPPVAESAGCPVIFEQASLGGWSLLGHWNLARKADADAAFRPYEDPVSGKFNLRQKLESRDWDIVTIQQASHDSWRAESFDPYAEQLVGFIRRWAPHAEVVIQQTWSYRPGEKRLTEWGIDSTGMYEKLTANYVALAKRLKLRLIPTGLAVQLVRISAIGAYPGLEMISDDFFHLSRSGEYLQACVWFSLLFDRPVSEIRFAPPELAADAAQYLRDCARAAVEVMPQHHRPAAG